MAAPYSFYPRAGGNLNAFVVSGCWKAESSLCQHVARAKELYDYRSPSVLPYARNHSPEAKRDALETTLSITLDYLKNQRDIIRSSALLQHAQVPDLGDSVESLTFYRQPDFYFQDWNGQEYLLDAKNIWYNPIQWVNSMVRFYRQPRSWIEQNVFSKRWDSPKYTEREFYWGWDGEKKFRLHRMVKVDPAKVTKVLLTTIPSLNQNAFLALKERKFSLIFTDHPILPLAMVNLELAAGLGCGLTANYCLKDALEDMVEERTTES